MVLIPISIFAQNSNKPIFDKPEKKILNESFDNSIEALRFTGAGNIVGENGSTLIASTTTAVGSYYALQALTSCVIDTLIDSGRDGDNINGVTIPSGTTIFGVNMTRIKLSSGAAIAYKK